MKNSYKEIFINELLELKKRTNILNILLNHCDKIVILKPQIEGRDIDILLINPRNINDLLTKLKNIEEVTVRYNGIDRISIVDREIELDVYLSISWLGLNILPNRYVLDRLIEIDPDYRMYIPDPTLEFTLLLIHSLVHMRLNILELCLINTLLRKFHIDINYVETILEKYAIKDLLWVYQKILNSSYSSKIRRLLLKNLEIPLPINILFKFLIKIMLSSNIDFIVKKIYVKRILRAIALSLVRYLCDTLRGIIIVFEGIDASGKTTQAKKLIRRLKEHGIGVTYVHLEENNPIVRFKESVRKMLRISRSSNVLLRTGSLVNTPVKLGNYSISKFSLKIFLRIFSIILYRLIFSLYVFFESMLYDVVVVDRYVYESLIGLFIKGLPIMHVWKLSKIFPKPHIVILLDVDPRISYSRRSDVKVYPIEFYIRYRMYLLLFSKLFDFKVVNSGQDLESTFRDIISVLSNHFPYFTLLEAG